MDVLKIGVTGSAGSGKSLVCKGFEKMGLVTLDCDRIAREVVEPGQPAYEGVVSLFGREVVCEDRSLDRAGMRQIIVENPVMREQLEALLHPLIIEEVKIRMKTAAYGSEKACAVEVPLLFELGMEEIFDTTLVVTADDEMLEKRISVRDRVDRESAKKILALQMSQEEKIKRADHVIQNQGDVKELVQALERVYSRMKKEHLTKKI